MNPYAPPQADCESSLARTIRHMIALNVGLTLVCLALCLACVALLPLIWWYYAPLVVVSLVATLRGVSDVAFWVEQRRSVCDNS